MRLVANCYTLFTFTFTFIFGVGSHFSCPALRLKATIVSQLKCSCVALCISAKAADNGRANRRDKPTVGDRPRAPSPTPLPPPSHSRDVPVHGRRDQEDEDAATDADDDDDWDEIRSYFFQL